MWKGCCLVSGRMLRNFGRCSEGEVSPSVCGMFWVSCDAMGSVGTGVQMALAARKGAMMSTCMSMTTKL